MRRNYASLDLAALSAAAPDDDDAGDVDLATMDADAAALYADVVGLDSDEQHAAAAVAYLSLDDPRGSIGCPLEMMADENRTSRIHDHDSRSCSSSSRPRPTSPPSAVPMKPTTLPSIRPSANDPVRRTHMDFASSPTSSSGLSCSPYASKSKLAGSSTQPILLRAAASDCGPVKHPAPLVPIHRNVIQTV